VTGIGVGRPEKGVEITGGGGYQSPPHSVQTGSESTLPSNLEVTLTIHQHLVPGMTGDVIPQEGQDSPWAVVQILYPVIRVVVTASHTALHVVSDCT
jgi:hypothetical protein